MCLLDWDSDVFIWVYFQAHWVQTGVLVWFSEYSESGVGRIGPRQGHSVALLASPLF